MTFGALALLLAFIFYYVLWVIPVTGIVALFADEETVRWLVFGPVCYAAGHEWATEYTYGVEPVCLKCGKSEE